MNTPDPFSRIRGQLHQAASEVRLAAGSEIATIRAAHRRRNRSRALIGVTTAAAVGGGTIVAIQQLGKTSPDSVAVGEGAGTTPDQAVAPAGTAVTTVPALVDVPASTTPGWIGSAPPDVPVQPAVSVDSAYTWNVMTPDAAQTVYGMWQGRVPGVIISTAPGRAADPNGVPTQQAYYTADGVTFEPLDVDLHGNLGRARLFADGDSIYRVGTAPGVAENEPNPILVDVSTDRGATWSTVEVPLGTHELRSLPFVSVMYEPQVVATEAGPVIVVNGHADLDLRDFQDELGDRGWEITDTGVKVMSHACYETGATTTLVVSGGTIAGSPVATASGLAEQSDQCETAEYTFDELGIPAESVDAVGSMQGRPSTHVYRVVDGQAVELDPPPGVSYLAVTAGSGSSSEFHGADDSGNQRRFRLTADSAWSELQLPAPIAWSGSSPMSSATHQFSWVGTGEGGNALAASAGGDWTYASLDALYGEFERADSWTQAVTPDGLALGVAVRTDLIAEQGGVSITAGDVTLYQPSNDGTRMEVRDAATGEPLDGASLDWNAPDGAPRVLAADGTVLADFSQADMAALQAHDDEPEWAIVTTADGVHVASESVAGLLGVSDTDIAGLRVNSVGRQVIVTVALNQEAEPGVKEQRILVGTPNE